MKKYPINADYAGNKYPLEKLTEELRIKYPESIYFNEKGFPDFKPYAQEEVIIQNLIGDHDQDFKKANIAIGRAVTPKGFTWHHMEDGRTMQLVPQDLHSAVRHTGGVAKIKKEG